MPANVSSERLTRSLRSELGRIKVERVRFAVLEAFKGDRQSLVRLSPERGRRIHAKIAVRASEVDHVVRVEEGEEDIEVVPVLRTLHSLAEFNVELDRSTWSKRGARGRENTHDSGRGGSGRSARGARSIQTKGFEIEGETVTVGGLE